MDPPASLVIVRITPDPLSLEQALADLGPPYPGEGATVTFSGVVRADELDGARVEGILYEAYRVMAEKEARNLAEEALVRFGLSRMWVGHRVGEVPVGETAFLVVIRASHRREAFDALVWYTDAFKRRVPIWKKERFTDGRERWKREASHD